MAFTPDSYQHHRLSHRSVMCRPYYRPKPGRLLASYDDDHHDVYSDLLMAPTVPLAHRHYVVYDDDQPLHRYVLFVDQAQRRTLFVVAFVIDCDDCWVACYVPCGRDRRHLPDLILTMDGAPVRYDWASAAE